MNGIPTVTKWLLTGIGAMLLALAGQLAILSNRVTTNEERIEYARKQITQINDQAVNPAEIVRIATTLTFVAEQVKRNSEAIKEMRKDIDMLSRKIDKLTVLVRQRENRYDITMQY